MAKTRLEIRGMSCQHCVKTVTDALTTLEGVQRVKVNLRKGEAMVRYDASYITDANLVEAITEVGFEAGTKTKPLSLILIGSILITLLSITSCSDMPYTGSMLTAEDVDRYVTIGEDSACLLSRDESVCITLIPETGDDSRPIIHIHPRKLIYVFYYKGVQIMRAEIVTDTTEIMEQVRGTGEDDQPPSGNGGVRDDEGDGSINGGGGTQQPGDGSIPRSDDGTQQPDDGTQQPGDGSIPRSDGGNGGTPQPPPPLPPPSNGGNQNGGGNNGQGNNGQGNNGQGNNGQGNNGQGNNGQGNNGQGNNGQGNNGQGNNGQGNNRGNTTVRVQGGSEGLLGTGDLIDLRLRTGPHDAFNCPTGLQSLTVTAYTDMELSQVRGHQHWSACKDNTDNVTTIFLYRHPALTCDVGPNTHYLKIQGETELIIITEFDRDTQVDCP